MLKKIARNAALFSFLFSALRVGLLFSVLLEFFSVSGFVSKKCLFYVVWSLEVPRFFSFCPF